MHLVRPLATPGLLSYYQFNEGGGVRVYDKVSARDGELTGGARRTPSGAIVGDGASDIVRLPEGTSTARFTTLGDVMDVAYGVAGDDIMLTRLHISPTAPPANRMLVGGRWWIVDVFSSTQRTEVASITLDASTLFTVEEGASRRFLTVTRGGWSTDTSWTLARGRGDATFNAASRTLTQGFSSGLGIPHQWVIAVEGGPVNVSDDPGQGPLELAPQPANDHVFMRNVPAGVDITIVDLFGRERLRVRADEGGSTTCDIRALEPGTYIVCWAHERRTLVILR
jgi:hypothetical protein